MEARSHRDELDGAGCVWVRGARTTIDAHPPAFWRLCNKRHGGEQHERGDKSASHHRYDSLESRQHPSLADGCRTARRDESDRCERAPDGCGASFLLRSPWAVLILLPLFLLFLFLHLLLLAFFLVFLATFVSHACSFFAIMTRDGE